MCVCVRGARLVVTYCWRRASPHAVNDRAHAHAMLLHNCGPWWRWWLRSKRDSKAGISFLAVNDGSHFDSLQCVAPNELSNYEEEVLKLSTGCAVIVSGELVTSQGGGQNVEIQATKVELVGDIDDPESYPIAKKRHTFEYHGKLLA